MTLGKKRVRLSTMQKHKFDHDGSCLKNGNTAEAAFAATAKTLGYRPEKAAFGFDVRHVDFFLWKGEELAYKADVKARKRLTRTAEGVQDELCFVEVKSGRAGWPSWLDGDADVIAFEREKDFIITPRLALKEMVFRLCDLTKFVSKSSDCLYKAYRRWTKPEELLTLVKFDDIISEIDVELWRKTV